MVLRGRWDQLFLAIRCFLFDQFDRFGRIDPNVRMDPWDLLNPWCPFDRLSRLVLVVLAFFVQDRWDRSFQFDRFCPVCQEMNRRQDLCFLWNRWVQ